MTARALLLLLLALAAGARPATALNHLVVVADDAGVDKISAYSTVYPNTGVPTPNIDAIAAGGIRFDRMVTDPLCSATRAALLTGRQGWRTGAGGSFDGEDPNVRIPETDMTAVKTLRAAGWRTSLIGKYHLCDSPTVVCDHYAHAVAMGFERTSVPGGRTSDTNFEWWVDGVMTQSVGTYIEKKIADAAIAELAAWDGDEPALLWLAWTAAHGCIVGDLCPPDDQTPHFDAACSPGGAADITEACLDALDYNLGRVLAEVDWSDTCVWFLGDNGSLSFATEFPYNSSHAKGTVYLQGVRTPFAVRGACVAPSEVGTAGAQLVQVTDIPATWLDLAGLGAGLANGTLGITDGIPITPYLSESSTPTIRQVARSQVYLPDGLPYNPTTKNDRAAEHGNYRLLRKTDGTFQMFDWVADLHEASPLNLGALNPAQQAAYDLMLPIVTLPESTPSSPVRHHAAGAN